MRITPHEPIDPDSFEITFESEYGHPIRYYDDGFGILWYYEDAGGYRTIVRASGECSALDCVYDEMPTIREDELHEAYDMTKEEYTARMEACRNGTEQDWPELAEGYQHQSNATGTGIISIDLNGESLRPLTKAEMERLGIKMIIHYTK